MDKIETKHVFFGVCLIVFLLLILIFGRSQTVNVSTGQIETKYGLNFKKKTDPLVDKDGKLLDKDGKTLLTDKNNDGKIDAKDRDVK